MPRTVKKYHLPIPQQPVSRCTICILNFPIVTFLLFVLVLQSIGFVGPGVALIGLNAAKSPIVASAWLTVAVSLKSFGHSGFLVNFQVSCPSLIPSTF
jgi:hypothetical protein